MKKVWLKVGIGLVVASGAYLGASYIISKRKAKKSQEDAKKALEAGSTSVSSTAIAQEFPLKKGSTGVLVEMLQEWLNKENNESLKVDGKFGPKTEDAVKRNQTPFETFKAMHPEAIEGQVSEKFFKTFVK